VGFIREQGPQARVRPDQRVVFFDDWEEPEERLPRHRPRFPPAARSIWRGPPRRRERTIALIDFIRFPSLGSFRQNAIRPSSPLRCSQSSAVRLFCGAGCAVEMRGSIRVFSRVLDAP